MGAHSCGPLRSACPRSSMFPLRSTLPRSCTKFFLRSPALPRSCFAFLCFCSCQYNGWGGRGEVWLIPNATTWGCFHGGGRGTTGLSLTTNGGQTCVRVCRRGRGALCHCPVVSLQEREFSVPIISRSAFPRSCIKFAFPRARAPKMHGTRERGSAETRSQERAPISADDDRDGTDDS